jgi:hypothetical protein
MTPPFEAANGQCKTWITAKFDGGNERGARRHPAGSAAEGLLHAVVLLLRLTGETPAFGPTADALRGLPVGKAVGDLELDVAVADGLNHRRESFVLRQRGLGLCLLLVAEMVTGKRLLVPVR